MRQMLDYYICDPTVDLAWVQNGATVNLKLTGRLLSGTKMPIRVIDG